MKQTSGLIIPPTPHRRGDPPDTNAELTVYNLGPNREDALEALRLLAEQSDRQMRRFEGSMPVEDVPLPGIYYDNDNPFVQRLRATGCRFTITVYRWLCPAEVYEDMHDLPARHGCNQTCSVTRVVETL
jgi:hypothetical protein